jgi:cytidylate kinase
MRLRGVDRDTAERDLKTSDLAREAYVKTWYRADPSDAQHYDLVIDSTRLPLDCCLEMIVTAVDTRMRSSVQAPGSD